MTSEVNQGPSAADHFLDNSFEEEVAQIAAGLVQYLYRLRVLQQRLDVSEEDSMEKKILADVTTKVRAAIGRPEYYGMLDLLGIQMREEWPEGAIVSGRYIVATPAGESREYPLYRFDTNEGPRYGMPELTFRGFTMWHTSHEGVIMHLSSSLGVPPGGRYVIEPDKNLGRAAPA